jgi:hypothetical protein
MQCQIDTLGSLSRRNILMDTLERISAKDCTFTVLDPEDLKGLREWVAAKRMCEVNPEKRYGQIYSAPWRIG